MYAASFVLLDVSRALSSRTPFGVTCRVFMMGLFATLVLPSEIMVHPVSAMRPLLWAFTFLSSRSSTLGMFSCVMQFLLASFTSQPPSG